MKEKVFLTSYDEVVRRETGEAMTVIHYMLPAQDEKGHSVLLGPCDTYLPGHLGSKLEGKTCNYIDVETRSYVSKNRKYVKDIAKIL